ncbi:uncharacterized protein KQ657_001037 [Scheffersomyces spartinae]|uniref:AB hydrolase-1 domain-containing protein n=1 Tax=Scheffersomyces spartinae TaxID=45513 RepID=A0A9P8AI58_9ASCO|nr:uncharacterized protein KQ657_001037 [Scheffersomyces spartinae]KAG7193274.1 hypothetical protein KQ657_001037 [Scheffersomyces spartinae]
MSLYTTEKKICEAAFPRHKGSTVSTSLRLNVVYHKYKTTTVLAENDIKINLVFVHGTGMNKAVWKYHINKLFQLAKSKGWPLDLVISIDAIQLGDSAILNKGKLGWLYHWADGAKDINSVIRHEQGTTGDYIQDDYHKNVAIGHSIGGHQVLVASFYEPELYAAVVPIEAVVYSNPAYTQKFIKVFGKLSGLILDTFDLIGDVNMYFKELSFYRNTNPEILDDFLKEEIYVVEEGEAESLEIKYKTKCSRENQMVSYISSAISLTHAMALLPLLKNRVYHIVGTEATWNPPESVSWIRDNIDSKLITAIDLPGEHLLNIENPDQMVDTIGGIIDKESEHYKRALETSPFSRGKDTEKSVEQNLNNLLTGDVLNVDYFEVSLGPETKKSKL